jgi:hypothetical protein
MKAKNFLRTKRMRRLIKQARMCGGRMKQGGKVFGISGEKTIIFKPQSHY